MSTNDARRPFPEPCNCWEYPVTHRHDQYVTAAVAPQLPQGTGGIVALKDYTDEQIRKELDRRRREVAEAAKGRLAIMLRGVLEALQSVPEYADLQDEVEATLEILREAGYGQ